jgi:SHS2 domain-containing protein
MPFRFVDEITTADVAFEAWGGSLEELFISAAAALLRTMSAVPDQVLRRQELIFRLEHEKLDLLLLLFLQELIFYKDARKLLLHAERVEIVERQGFFYLDALVSGEQLDTSRHCLLVDVKAVTLHRLQLQFDNSYWKAVVVLDV